MVVGGLAAGNPVERIMMRALIGLPLGFLLGVVVGSIGMFIVQDQLDRSMGDDAASSESVDKTGSKTANAPSY